MLLQTISDHFRIELCQTHAALGLRRALDSEEPAEDYAVKHVSGQNGSRFGWRKALRIRKEPYRLTVQLPTKSAAAADFCECRFERRAPSGSTVARLGFVQLLEPGAAARQALLLQKVVTDRLGNLSWSCSFDPEVVEPWKFLRFRARECRCEPLHCQSDCLAVAFPAVHEQDTASDFAVVAARRRA